MRWLRAWSEPYVAAGYNVRRCSLPDLDVRNTSLQDLALPGQVRGVLAAPPCDQFSIARTSGGERDILSGLEVVLACLRWIADAAPIWWAIENPGSGLLRRWLGRPRYTFQPHHHGDDHTKLTSLWGRFHIPPARHCRRSRRMPGNTPAQRAITPAGFAQAFFDANP